MNSFIEVEFSYKWKFEFEEEVYLFVYYVRVFIELLEKRALNNDYSIIPSWDILT